MNQVDNPPDGVAPSRRRLLGAALALFVAAAVAAPVEPGAALPPLQLSDQNERPWRVEPGTRFLLFAADKAAGDLLQETLGADGAGWLAEHRALYLADLHKMPALVTRLFALPALRALPYAVGLVRDESVAAWPQRKGQVTVIELADGAVVAVSYAADADALRRLPVAVP
ncbi:hypothetical protein CKO44_18880 [Rubrivivax gelatinosus]|uniref:hypothetical protein n=1 Tax=Rubrivivax gelatinosus TaxID=28068 RepID=UPI00190456DE|nr:hypothetical protein [Rubrivivax gelatinosus]MBK1615530.1 hypothetical protein [Rubrivivax gelatinosus]